MKKKSITPVLVLLAICAAFVGGAAMSTPFANTGVGDGIVYHSKICACKNSDICNDEITICNHNTLTNGSEMIERYLFANDGGGNFTYLALSNGSADYPSSGDHNFSVELTGGLARAEAAFYSWGQGNWSLTYTWTADAEFLSVNTTGIFNNSNTGLPQYFAGGTFTPVNLESSDTLTINYSVWVAV